MVEATPAAPRPWHRRPPLLVGLGIGASVVYVGAIFAVVFTTDQAEPSDLLAGLAVLASFSLRALFVASKAAERKETHARRDIALSILGLEFPFMVFAIIVAVFIATFRLPSA
jgi:disulfide bond formation protein DsbB